MKELNTQEIKQVGGGFAIGAESFPKNSLTPIYVKFGGDWLPTGSEPYIPVNPDDFS